jgi:hypothetical protein
VAFNHENSVKKILDQSCVRLQGVQLSLNRVTSVSAPVTSSPNDHQRAQSLSDDNQRQQSFNESMRHVVPVPNPSSLSVQAACHTSPMALNQLISMLYSVVSGATLQNVPLVANT